MWFKYVFQFYLVIKKSFYEDWKILFLMSSDRKILKVFTHIDIL